MGADVRVVMTKWGGRPHWEFDATLLGEDEHGTWLAVPRGTHFSRPGMSFDGEVDQVALVPGPDAGGGGWWSAAFHAPGIWVSTYVDMATASVWSDDGRTVTAVDLDLDVVERADGTVFVDDEDEFAEHQVRHGYPPAVVAGAEASCAWVHDAVLRHAPPFDGSHLPWLERVERS